MTTSQNAPQPSRDEEAEVLRARARTAMAMALREAMARRNFTKKRLGELAGITRSANYMYLDGERGISTDDLFAYAHALDVDPAELIRRATELMEDR